jgi:hypothetical protein
MCKDNNSLQATATETMKIILFCTLSATIFFCCAAISVLLLFHKNSFDIYKFRDAVNAQFAPVAAFLNATKR